MDGALYQKVEKEGGWLDLSRRAKWRLSGADRIRYLNGQVTQDVRAANAGETRYACVTNVKGKIEGDLFIHTSPDGQALFLDAEPEAQESLGLRLEKYIIADDAELHDVTDEWVLIHVFGGLTEKMAAIADALAAGGGRWLRSNRMHVPGADLWLPAGVALDSLVEIAGPALSEGEAETLRILQHVPRAPNELNAEAFPPEAGLESRAMSFTKGCYIGQEILSRIKTTGRMPRQLIAWEATTAEAEAAVGDAIYEEAGGGGGQPRVVGAVTSAVRHPLSGAWVGLAYVKQSAAVADSVLLVGHDMPRIGVSIKISGMAMEACPR